jgi:hypothetical protein
MAKNVLKPKVEKTRVLPKGIWKHYNMFRIKTRDFATSKYTVLFFRTLEEAVAAKTIEREKQLEYKCQMAARPQSEIRAENVERYGNNSNMEREFAIAFCNADGTFEVMNDGVLSDVCGFLYEDKSQAIGTQIKTTSGPMKGQTNTWLFRNVLQYVGMPVLCWRIDHQDGWIFDGTELDKRGKENISITPGSGDGKTFCGIQPLGGVQPRGIEDLIALLKHEVATNPTRFPTHTKKYLSFQFSGTKAHSTLKERIGLELYMKHVDTAATFPEAQNGSYDLLSGNDKYRLQFKTAHEIEGKTGLFVNLSENAGRVDGKRTTCPYDTNAFDMLVVYYLDWKTKKAHMWCIPVSELIARGYLRTVTQDGRYALPVYKSVLPQSRYGKTPDTWTATYYNSDTQPLDKFDSDVVNAAGHLLNDLCNETFCSKPS